MRNISGILEILTQEVHTLREPGRNGGCNDVREDCFVSFLEAVEKRERGDSAATPAAASALLHFSLSFFIN